MADDVDDIRDFYDRGVDVEEQRLLRRRLEFDLTLLLLHKHLPETGAVLEVGAGPGRYTEVLLERGHPVTAVDLSPQQLARCGERIARRQPGAPLTLIEADARDLGGVPGGFAAALLMGPLYHLVEFDDRLRAIRQVYDRLQPGGVIFAAWVSRLGMLADLVARDPGWIEHLDEVRSIMADGRDPPGPRAGFRGYFATAEEIEPLFEAQGFGTVALAGVEPVIAADDASYDALDPELRRRWLELFSTICAEPSIVGASRHLLYIGRR